MTEEERIVRGAWEWYTCFPPDFGSDTWLVQVADEQILNLNIIDFHGETEAEAWHAAAEFTIRRQEEIRQVEKQIDWIQAASLVYRRHLLEELPRNWTVLSQESDRIALGILAARQVALTELQRGWKGTK